MRLYPDRSQKCTLNAAKVLHKRRGTFRPNTQIGGQTGQPRPCLAQGFDKRSETQARRSLREPAQGILSRAFSLALTCSMTSALMTAFFLARLTFQSSDFT